MNKHYNHILVLGIIGLLFTTSCKDKVTNTEPEKSTAISSIVDHTYRPLLHHLGALTAAVVVDGLCR